MMEIKMLRLAYLNGHKTTARKAGRHWMVGGDFVSKGANVQIAALHKDWANGGERWAWHKLKGCFLVFDDFMSNDQVAEQEALS
ncbi:hypothetical protein GCM10027347_59270 [Larkinella harenae]